MRAHARPRAVRAAEKEPRDTTRELLRDLRQVHEDTRAGGALDLQRVAIIIMVTIERLDQQVIERQPHRAAPVRVAAEHARVAVSRHVRDAQRLPPEHYLVRSGVRFRQRANAVRRQELLFVEYVLQHPNEAIGRGNREQAVEAPVRQRAPGHEPREIGPIVEEPAHTIAEAGQALQHVDVDREHREEGNDAHHRANPERNRGVADRHLVVIEAVLFVP